jgi:prophage antirepressor-like protein
MNELQIFQKDNFHVRAIEKDGEPWFIAKDACETLEISNSRDAVSRLDEDEKGVVLTDTPGGKQQLTIVSEPGLYSLVLGSRKPEAKAFKRWITHEVIPAIRKTGGYIQPQTIEDLIIMQAQSVKELKSRVELTETKQAEQAEELQDIRDAVSLSPNDWRKNTSTLINKMALNIGGYDHIKPLRIESYKVLDERMGVDVQCRLTNKRRRMADEGICKSKRDKLTPLDAIADDKKLIEGYVAIVKEMAIKYGGKAV